MKIASLLHLFAFLVRALGIWYITEDMTPHTVMNEAIKKWGSPAAALAQLIHIKSPKLPELYASCILWRTIPPNDPLASLQTLHHILRQIPPQMQETALTFISYGDMPYAAHILMQLAPFKMLGLAPIAKTIVSQWASEPRSDELALNFYHALGAYGAPPEEILWLLVRAFVARGMYAQAEPLLLKLVRIRPSADVWWHLVLVLHVLQRPSQQRLEGLYHFITSAPLDPPASQAWKMMSALYNEMLGDGTVSENGSFYLQTLRSLLEIFPAQRRAEILALVTDNDDTRTAHLLSLFAFPLLPGLDSIARAILLQWQKEPKSDELALQFYQSLTGYEVSQEERDFLLARAYIARKQDHQAEALLQGLAQSRPTPDVLWLLVSVYQTLSRPPRLLLETLHAFTSIAPVDRRTSQVWKMMGDIYGEQLGEGMAAVHAYEQAEALGLVVPQLLAFRIGNWDTIPALRTHPDYAFPVTVVVDLEVDPKPEAKPGERVFEVAAVRTKGKTTLREYQSFIRRPFHPAKMGANDTLEHAPEPERVAAELRIIIGASLIVGHNLRAFDAEHLRGLGVPVAEDSIIDTLAFAHLLYPDSLRHNLALLCHAHTIEVSSGEWHTALPDAQACARLLYALGEELIRRGGALLTGIRALVSPGSAFDRAVLQPRNLFADPKISWSLDPTPSVSHVIVPLQALPDSSHMQKVLQSTSDVLVELHDPETNYIAHLPTGRRTVVTVHTRTRLEHMLAACQQRKDIYVLPDPRTTLCPHRLRTLIEHTTDNEYKLLLFCLYQASHNKDVSTLYPMRLPSDEAYLLQLRRDLLWACCSSDPDSNHLATCPTAQAHLTARSNHHLLLATHEALVHLETPPEAQSIVVDDIAELQMHLAEYLAEQVRSDQLQSWMLTPTEQDALNLLLAQINNCVQAYISQPGYHERMPLRSLVRYLATPIDQNKPSVLTTLEQSGITGQCLAKTLQHLCTEATDDARDQKYVHAHWLDLWFADSGDTLTLERWAIYGLSANIGSTFTDIFWRPYKQHIVCGTALTTNKNKVTFLERSLNLPQGLPLLKDKRPHGKVYIPSPDTLPPAGFLRRKSWIMQVGRLLYILQAQASGKSLLITLNNKIFSEALACTFKAMQPGLGRQVLTTQFGWTTSKIAERLTDSKRQVLALASPRVRRSQLTVPVDIEVTGPLQFLNQQDPLVAAQMRVFAHCYPSEGPFSAYLLPQALLELKARLSSRAELHVILDSRLHSKIYRDEVLEILNDFASLERNPFPLSISEEKSAVPEDFLTLLAQALEQRGFDTHEAIADKELRHIIRAFWDADDFREFLTDDETKPKVSQKDIVRGVLNGQDQLLVASTGGGKSLCFQLPALLLAEEMPPKVTLVFSPLISLMSNQVEELRRKNIFSAIVLNSSLSAIQRQEHLRGIKRGDYSIVYVAPEQIRSSSLRRALEGREIGLIAIDEAHCLSQWGHDFRTDYFAVKDWIARICGEERRRFPILALTATARKGYKDTLEQERSDQTSTIRDIIDKLTLNIQERDAVITSPQRDELEFHVEKIIPPSKKCKCGAILQLQSGKVICQRCGYSQHLGNNEVQEIVDAAKIQKVAELLNGMEAPGLRLRWDRPSGERQRGLIYCAYKKTTSLVAEELRKRIPKLHIATYHADLEPKVREDVLQSFTRSDQDGLDIVVATNAFGMGIDVRRLGFVIHFDIPGTPEAYYQEAGRAGRDELFRSSPEKALCILLYHPSDLNKQRYLSRKNVITRYQIEDVYDVLCKLQRDVVGCTEEQKADRESNQEIVFTAPDLAARAGVSNDNVQMILHYLEYHTLLNDKPILEQGETAYNILRIKFERGYQERCVLLPESSPSRPLFTCFQTSEGFRLNEDTTTAISLKELAQSLNWSISNLEREIRNLVQRGIITYECDGRIKWVKDASYARTALTHLQRNVRTLIAGIDKKKSGALLRGETVFVDLTEFYAGQKLDAVPLPSLLHFLATLAHSNSNDDGLRLFKRFARPVRSSQPGRFEICLWLENNDNPLTRLDQNFAGLRDALSVLERQRVSDEEQVFDLLGVEVSYQRRQRLHYQLLLLDILGLLKYISDPSLGLALRVTFKQLYATRDQLKIDLTSLRLKEAYEKNKLKLMERYASETPKHARAEEFNTYFYGKKPIIERTDQTIRKDLTPEQQVLFKLERGYHLIEGPAGSGKTTVLVEFIKYLVDRKQVPLERIMVTTHYNSATNRIARALEVLQEDSSAALATTINKFGEKIFRQHRFLLLRSDGIPYYENDPQVKSLESTSKQDQELVSKALTTIFKGTWQGGPWPLDLERPQVKEEYQPNDAFEKRYLEMIKQLREHGIFPTSSLSKDDLTAMFSKGDKEKIPLYYAVYLLFLQLRGQRNYYTFDDQVLFALAILRDNPSIRQEYQHFFEHIIIDELQDFTPAQAALLLELCTAQRNVLAFGDRGQEIRPKGTGAASVFEQFISIDSCGQGKAHYLTTNFRSTQPILNLIQYLRRSQVFKNLPSLKAAHGPGGDLPVLLNVHIKDRHIENTNTMIVPMETMIQAALDRMKQIPETERGSVALIVAKSDWSDQVVTYLRRNHYDFSTLSGLSLYQLHHVERVVVYLHLIVHPQKDADIERLLRYCVAPYFNDQQIKALKDIAQKHNRSLFKLLRLSQVLKMINVTPEQEVALQTHLAVLTTFNPNSKVSEVMDKIKAIEDGPYTAVAGQEQKVDDINSAMKNLISMTVIRALDAIKQHLSFLEDGQKHTGLVVTTVDHAKSEEFDTVFYLGADYLPNAYPNTVQSYTRRLYVGLSRARQRLFLVVNGEQQKSHVILSSIPKHLYKEEVWFSVKSDIEVPASEI